MATIEEVQQDQIPDGSNVSVYPKANQKARKHFEKLGLKKVEGITRVTLRRGPNTIFVIADPEVYRHGANGSYLVFGEAKIEDLSARAQAAAQAAAAQEGESAPKDQASITADLEAAASKISLEENESDLPEPTAEDLEAAGLSESDLAMIKDQVNLPTAQILEAYKKNDKDVINTIVSLTA